MPAVDMLRGGRRITTPRPRCCRRSVIFRPSPRFAFAVPPRLLSFAAATFAPRLLSFAAAGFPFPFPYYPAAVRRSRRHANAGAGFRSRFRCGNAPATRCRARPRVSVSVLPRDTLPAMVAAYNGAAGCPHLAPVRGVGYSRRPRRA